MRFSNLCIGLAGLAASVCHASADAAPTVAAPTVDPLARYVKSSGWVSYKGERFFVELMIDGDRAAIRMRSSRSPNLKQKIYGIESPGDALAVLADKRLAFVWPALTQWTGPGLALAKERYVRIRRAAWNSRTSDSAPANVSESTVSEPLKALLQLTDALENTGQGKEAEALLRAELAKAKFADNYSLRSFEWFSLAARLAANLGRQGHKEAALNQYLFVERAMKKGPFAVNATVSRAALLAEWGRYSEALYAIETAESVFDEQNKGDRIPGSDRQFAWIRACALQGLGRIAEAEKAFARALGDREWRDPDFVIQNDREVQLRARFCMRQAEKVAEVLVRNLNGPGLSSAPVLLQPGYTRMHVDHRFLDSVRADLGVAPKAMEWVRVLPEEMRDAINGWRERPAKSTTAG